MREIRQSGSEGGARFHSSSLPLSSGQRPNSTVAAGLWPAVEPWRPARRMQRNYSPTRSIVS
jgi:hypothetical protein